MEIIQGLRIRYNFKKNLEKYFPDEKLGIADRLILNSIINQQRVLGFESGGVILGTMESFGYKTQKPYKAN